MKNYQKKKNKKKNKSWAECALRDHKKSVQKENSEWTLTVNSKRKNIQRLLMEDLYTGNVTNDTTEQETMAPMGLDGNYIFT